jgi:hypothetical protein
VATRSCRWIVGSSRRRIAIWRVRSRSSASVRTCIID